MATQLAIRLSTQYADWAKFFQLVNHSQFKDALTACRSLPRSDASSDQYAQFSSIFLQLCIDAAGGVEPKAEHAITLQAIIESCHRLSIHAVQIESLFLMFDTFAANRDQALSVLDALQSQMDEHTHRRYLHRKGLALVHSGSLHEAFELWSPLVTSVPSVEDSDDSMSTLLIDLGRVSTELGKYSDSVDIYNQALACSRSPHNQGLALIRLSNALERLSRPAQADKRRIEYFHLIKREYPTHCASCSAAFGKEPKFLIPCCKTIVHSECLRQVVSESPDAETSCPFCSTKFTIADVVDPTSVEGRKYKKTKRGTGLAVGEKEPESIDQGI